MMDEYIGEYIDIVRVKGLRESLGATTSYISYALDSGLIDGAIVVKADERWKPEAIVVKNSHELEKSVGTSWVISPMVYAIVDALKVERLENIAIIGTPCQCEALRNMKEYPMQMGDLLERIKLIVGVFCMGSFSQDGFKTMLEKKFKISLPDIMDAKVTSYKFMITLRNGETKEISLEELEEDVQIACLSCSDFTAKYSDISFGNAGSSDGWRTAIVRSDMAMDILKKAHKNRYIEIEKFENIDVVRKYAAEKKDRAEKISKKLIR